MISIRKSLSELERAEQLRQLAAAGYANAIRAAAEYAVELDPAQAAELRQNLEKIREQLQNATRPEDYQAVQANLRGELRLYRDRSTEWLDRLQRDLQSSAIAMEILADGMNANGVDHGKRLETELHAMASVEHSNDLDHVKKVVRQAAENISESWEQLRRANQLVIAQLQDEIRSLHLEIDNERRALYSDPASGAWNRQKANGRIEDNLNRDDGFCLVVARVGNLKRLEASYSAVVISGALKALVKRILGIVGKDAMIARWSEEQFAIFLEFDQAHATSLAAEIATDLSARYSVQEDGVARSLTLRMDTSMIEHPPRGNPAKFREKLATLDALN